MDHLFVVYSLSHLFNYYMLPDFCGLQYVHSMKFCPYCIPYSLRSNEHFLLINSLLCLSFSGRMTALDCFSYCKLYYVFFCWQEIYVISLKLFNIFFLPLFRNFEHPMDISIASLHFFSHILRHFKIGSVRKCGILSFSLRKSCDHPDIQQLL